MLTSRPAFLRWISWNRTRHVEVPHLPRLVFHESQESDQTSDSERATALILGFGGAQPRHILRYVQLYQNLGLDCVSFTGHKFWDEVPKPDDGIVFSSLFNNKRHENRDIIIHCLSMNGFRSLIKLYRWMETEGEDHNSQIKAVVFDSGPCEVSAKELVLTHTESRFPIKQNKQVSALSSMPKALVHATVNNVLGLTNPDALAKRSLFHFALDNIKLPKFQLYIYSENDEHVNYKSVEQFIKHQKTRDCDIATRKFTHTHHLEHLKSVPDEYEMAVRGILCRSGVHYNPSSLKRNM